MNSEIQFILSRYRQNGITEDIATWLLSKVDKEVLVDFIVDAFNRGWITNFNLGLNEDGEII